MRLLAYLDANSGSIIASAVAAGFAGAAVAGKVGWHRVKGKLSPKRRQEEAATTDEATDA